MPRRLTLDIVKERLRVINPSIEILSEEYVNNTTNLECKCLVCGYKWHARFANLSQGKGCHKCNGGVRLTIEHIKSELTGINPNIEIISEKYKNSSTKIQCKCKKCDNKWFVVWDSLKSGFGCPKCAIKKRTNNLDEVKQKLFEINKDIIILSKEYRNNIEKLKCVCKKHNFTFFMNWKSLQSGHGCPQCSKENIRDALANSLEDVKSRLANISPNIKIISDNYISNKDKMRVRCDICKHVWNVSWINLLAGNGCPKCYDKKRGWSFENWVEMSKKSKHFDSYKLYIIKCYNKHELFFKVGITFNTMKRRYHAKIQMPYEYEIIKVIISESPIEIWNLEKEIKKNFSEYKIIPKIKFAGSETECFSQLPKLEDIINGGESYDNIQ